MKVKKNHNDPTFYVGYRFVNKQGYSAEIVWYRHNKSIDIKFDDCDQILTTTGLYIKAGLPLHPVNGKPQVGDQYPCKDGDTVEIVEVVSTTKIRCKWLSDGEEKWTSLSSLKSGVNKHPNNWKYKKGDLVKTKNNGVVEVLEYRSAIDILICFDNGEEKSVTAQDLRVGHARPDSKFVSRVGHKFTTNSGWNGEVVEWNNSSNVKVLWQDGSESIETWSYVTSGTIKPLFQPSVCGVGYIGEGRFVPRGYRDLPGGKEYAPVELYAYWQRMMTRCYNELEQQKPSSRSYIDCSISSEWHNFQNFAEWALKNPYYGNYDEKGKIWHIDKDILVHGNRVYSENTCLFIPNEINIIFVDNQIGNTGYLGVNYIKPATKGAKEGYIARCYFGGERKYLGYYSTPKLAYQAYREAKIEAAKELADKWEGKVDDRVITALRNFEERLPVDL